LNTRLRAKDSVLYKLTQIARSIPFAFPKRALSSILVGTSVFSFAVMANDSDAEQKPERVPTEELVEGIKSSDGRWFEVEVIIFERTDAKQVRETFEQPVPVLTQKNQWYFFDHIFNPDLDHYLRFLPNCNQELDPIERLKTAREQYIDVLAVPETEDESELYAQPPRFEDINEINEFNDLGPINAATENTENVRTDIDPLDTPFEPDPSDEVETFDLASTSVSEDDPQSTVDEINQSEQPIQLAENPFEETFSELLINQTPEVFWNEFQYYQTVVSSNWQFDKNLCLTANESLPSFWSWYLDTPDSELALNQDVSYQEMVSRPTGPDFDDFHDVYLIAPQNLQLLEQYEKLVKNKSTKPLLHMGWRQPGLSKSRAKPVYIKAGTNFTGTFSYDGNPVIKNEEPDESKNQEAKNGNSTEGLALNNDQQLNKPEQDKVEQFMNKLQSGAVVDFKNNKLIMPSVESMPEETWQLDGYITVHLNHYLFLDAEFNFREHETKSLDPDEYLDQLDLLVEVGEQPKTELQGELEDAVVISKINQQTGFEENNEFQLDDKVQYEYLKNYPFKQNRRTYSGDLHYLDHPKIGVLFQIRKYRH